MRHYRPILTFCASTALLAGCSGDDGSSSGSGGSIQLAVSGEQLALTGYAFPPAAEDELAFVDGWDLKLSKLLVTLDHFTLSENPDRSPTDQSQTGAKVAQVDGPWAIDLHAGGPLKGKGGSDEQAYPLAKLDGQNLNGGRAFDSTQRYAFGFELVPASASATKLQIDADDPDYAEMVEKGWVILYTGTATWKGTSCTSTNPDFDFSQLPKTVNFRFGFASPTVYSNCQNPDNDPADPLGEEEHQRGIQVKENQSVVAQATIHAEHPFWESFVHDSAMHFDQLAALAEKDEQGNWSVTLDSAKSVNYTAFEAGSEPLPWRSCLPSYTPPNDNPQMGFDSLTVPYNPAGSPSTSMRDYRDYMTYNQSTLGHLNADGLCFVERNYPSPP